MKRVAIVLILALSLIGCYRNIAKVERKWGPPARVEDRGDTIVYFYHFHKEYASVYARRGFGTGHATYGIVVVEITTDRNGRILGKRKYWKQPTEDQPKSEPSTSPR